MPILSIITVCFNAAKTIRKTIESVVVEKKTGIEYIIVDGQSTDETLNVIHSFKDSIDNLVSEPDDGIYYAMNKGVSLARGEYISFINADDYYMSGALSVVMEILEQGEWDIVYGKTKTITNEGTSSVANNRGFNNKIWTGMPCGHPSVFARRRLFDDVGLFNCDYRIAADYEWLLRVYRAGASTFELNNIIAVFSEGGISSNDIYKCALETYMASKSIRETIFDESIDTAAIDKWFMDDLKLKGAIEMFELYPDYVRDYLNSFFYNCKNIVVWGTGIWGRRISNVLMKTTPGILFYIDVDHKKQGLVIDGIDIRNPNVLEMYSGGLIVAVRKHENDILDQIEKLNNKKIKVLALSSIISSLGAYYSKRCI